MRMTWSVYWYRKPPASETDPIRLSKDMVLEPASFTSFPEGHQAHSKVWELFCPWVWVVSAAIPVRLKVSGLARLISFRAAGPALISSTSILSFDRPLSNFDFILLGLKIILLSRQNKRKIRSWRALISLSHPSNIQHWSQPPDLSLTVERVHAYHKKSLLILALSLASLLTVDQGEQLIWFIENSPSFSPESAMSWESPQSQANWNGWSPYQGIDWPPWHSSSS